MNAAASEPTPPVSMPGALASHIDDLPLVVSFFPTSTPDGPALGETRHMRWSDLVNLLRHRREGGKDGPNIVAARLKPEPNTGHGIVRRLKANVLARTVVMLDCETNKETGEVPPAVVETVARIEARGWAGALYTSHSHLAAAPRYRIVLPLTAEIEAELPASEVAADLLGLQGVLDGSKLGASSVFFLPSSPPGRLAEHHTVIIDGAPIDAEWMTETAGAVLAAREAVRARQHAEALAEAERRRAARAAAGFATSENLIERIRDRLDLEAELLRHGYTQERRAFLYPESESGVAGVYILTGSDGVQRVYSHHSGDPLSPGNLPSWCGVKAIDVVDVVTILEFSGDRKRALHTLAKRFEIESKELPKPEEPPPHPGYDGPDGSRPEPSPKRADRRTEKKAAADPWGEPVDFLADDATAAPVLEQHHVPAALWPFALDVAERLGVDPAAVALCGLVACASVISDAWELQPKRHDHTWTESARLWGAIVGDPSILKSPVISVTTKPLDKLEAEARAQHAAAMEQWKIDAGTAKLDDQPPPPKPKMARYMIEGTTIEALSEVLRDDEEARFRVPCRKVLSRHDEMSEFFGSLDRYKAGGSGGSDRGAYLRLYNGGRYTVDRIGRGSFAVPHWSACFVGGIQPGPIQRIARDAADDGLLQRFLYIVPGEQRQGVDRTPDHAALTRYRALFPALAAMQPAAAFGNDDPSPIVFHEDAHQHREDIDALATAMAAMPDTSRRLKAAFGKWPGLFARLCLTFHMIEVADHRARAAAAPFMHVITAETAEKAAGFMRDIVLPHRLRAEALMFSTDQSGHARWIAGYILSRRLDRIATRDVTQAYKALRAPEAKREMLAVMESLTALAWLEPEEPSNLAKGVSSWRVNPKVHAAFARQAEAEAARREAAKEQIAAAVARVRARR